tara:strand:- start:14485 stop:15480 length:996 start_codon:yes stop_codon:yes gene_type:complete
MEILDQAVFELFDQLEAFLRGDARMFVRDAQAIAAIAMLLYFGVKSFGLISGDERWEIMPLLRPFGLTLVIVFWGQFIRALEFPFDIFEGRTEALYNDQRDEVDLLMLEKNKLITEYALKLTEVSQDVEDVNGEDSDSWMGMIGVDVDDLVQEAKSLYLVVLAKFKYVLEQVINYIILAFFQVCVYIVFFLQMFFKHVLIVLGPLAFAISIIPAFKDSYTTWIGRFISVALYSTIARIVLIISMTFIRYALNLEIQMFENLMADENAFILYATGSNTVQISFIVALLTGAAAMLTVPTVSTWIVNTSGVGQAVGKMAKGGVQVAKTAGGAL